VAETVRKVESVGPAFHCPAFSVQDSPGILDRHWFESNNVLQPFGFGARPPRNAAALERFSLNHKRRSVAVPEQQIELVLARLKWTMSQGRYGIFMTYQYFILDNQVFMAHYRLPTGPI
jgi:hypothetical protein